MGESTRLVARQLVQSFRFRNEVLLHNSLVYNIPAKVIDDYLGHNLVVRSSSPSELADCISRDPLDIQFVQLLSVSSDTSILEGAADGLPVEIVLTDPTVKFARLYSFTSLLDTHPVRVSIPVVAGFSKAAKLAMSLNYIVKLEFGQPDDDLIEEVESVLDLYLHRGHVQQPVEFFQTVLLSIFHDQPTTLWEAAEEDPARVRYVTEDGNETISPRFSAAKLDGDLAGFIGRYKQSLVDEGRECCECEFFNRCGGYFKWPDKSYVCDGVKRLFRTLTSAVAEMKRDLSSYEATEHKGKQQGE